MDKQKQQFSSRLEEVWESKITISANELTSIIDMAFETRSKWTVCIVGESGIGKSMIPETYAKEKGIGFINLKGSGLLPEDVRGFGTIVKTVDDSCLVGDVSKYPDMALATAVNAYVSTPSKYVFHLMPLLEQAFTPGWKGILLLDEFAQASREVQDVYFQLIYDRRIDEKILSDDVIVMTAMNPPGLEEYGLNPLTKAAEDRLEFYVYKPVYSEWCKWAESAGILPELISYVRATPSCFDDNKGRRLHNLSDRLIAMKAHNLCNHRLMSAATTACLSGGHAQPFIKFLAGVSITANDILGFRDSIDETMRKVLSLSDDKRVAIISSINKELSAILSVKEESVRAVITSIRSAASSQGKRVVRPSTQLLDNCFDARNDLTEKSSEGEIEDYIARVVMYYAMTMFEGNADLMITFIRDLCAKTWPGLKMNLNLIMKNPEYSMIVQEVIKCQSATMTAAL